jgi:hypothetical protein
VKYASTGKAGGLEVEQLLPLRNGDGGVVEIESEWTARKREKMGILPKLKRRTPE